jgi:cell division protein FtsB
MASRWGLIDTSSLLKNDLTNNTDTQDQITSLQGENETLTNRVQTLETQMQNLINLLATATASDPQNPN